MTPVAPSPESELRRFDPPGARHPELLVPATLGIRHFSPASARALTRLLEAMQPQCILLEAPVDAAPALRDLGAKGTRPPVGLVGLGSPTDDARILYPLAPDSAEWVAVRWAHEHGCALEGIDLPGATQLRLANATSEVPEQQGAPDPYAGFAAAVGVPDFEVWWERHFEHAPHPDTYAEGIWALALGLRDQPWSDAQRSGWMVREAFMRRRIREVLAKGLSPERCVVVCGAIHAPALTHERPARYPASVEDPIDDAAAPHRDDREPPSDPGAARVLSWFPVALTSDRLRSTGRRGTIEPPLAYLQMLAQALSEGRHEELAPRFLGHVAERLRASGASTSAAEVIDAVRLAEQLAALGGTDVITLQDLSDAAMTCFTAGGVAAASVATAIETASQGSMVGQLLGARPLLAHELEQRWGGLGLPELNDGGLHVLELDLRPARESNARERSILLHRLRALTFSGIRLLDRNGAGPRAVWIERWELRAPPTRQEALFEAGLSGDTIETALLARLNARLKTTQAISALVEVLIEARVCALPQLLNRAAERVQRLELDSVPFSDLVGSAQRLRMAAPVSSPPSQGATPPEAPVVDLLLHAAIRRLPVLPELAGHDQADAMALRTLVAEVVATGIGRDALDRELSALATGVQGRPLLRGWALGLALELALVPLPQLTSLLAMRLGSVRIRETAAFLDALLAHDRRVLIASSFPEALEGWVRSADPIAFSRGLLPLRRAFSRWDAVDRAQLAARAACGAAPLTQNPEAATDPQALHPPDGPLARALERLDDLEL